MSRHHLPALTVDAPQSQKAGTKIRAVTWNLYCGGVDTASEDRLRAQAEIVKTDDPAVSSVSDRLLVILGTEVAAEATGQAAMAS